MGSQHTIVIAVVSAFDPRQRCLISDDGSQSDDRRAVRGETLHTAPDRSFDGERRMDRFFARPVAEAVGELLDIKRIAAGEAHHASDDLFRQRQLAFVGDDVLDLIVAETAELEALARARLSRENRERLGEGIRRLRLLHGGQQP